jgi:hypothetical protein
MSQIMLGILIVVLFTSCAIHLDCQRDRGGAQDCPQAGWR